ncbi:MAG TPA: hypothetical protein VHB78_14535 [Vicinamibacterales bacterium]|nr:hypothetical protein [Vicinamibacterales bacterium]
MQQRRWHAAWLDEAGPEHDMAGVPKRAGDRVQHATGIIGIAHMHTPRRRARARPVEGGDRPSRKTHEAVVV